MIQMILFCGNGISVDVKKREICFNGIDCVRYRTEKQFDVAYEMLMKVIEYCRKNERW